MRRHQSLDEPEPVESRSEFVIGTLSGPRCRGIPLPRRSRTLIDRSKSSNKPRKQIFSFFPIRDEKGVPLWMEVWGRRRDGRTLQRRERRKTRPRWTRRTHQPSSSPRRRQRDDGSLLEDDVHSAFPVRFIA